jgi:hypothetical protein
MHNMFLLFTVLNDSCHVIFNAMPIFLISVAFPFILIVCLITFKCGKKIKPNVSLVRSKERLLMVQLLLDLTSCAFFFFLLNLTICVKKKKKLSIDIAYILTNLGISTTNFAISLIFFYKTSNESQTN